MSLKKRNSSHPSTVKEDPSNHIAFSVIPGQSGERFDVCVSKSIAPLSRSHATTLISKGLITVDGHIKKPGYRLKAGQMVTGKIPAPESIDCKPENIPIDIIHEDDDLIVINKNAGLVVHPAPGNESGTLVNALLYHCPDIKSIGGKLRPGIVHRLDKDTSGVLVAAKNSQTLVALADAFKERKTEKQYLALVYGNPTVDHGKISLPIGRHPGDRKKMSTKSHLGRSALTLWRVKERYHGGCFLSIDIKTGRTHQIRTHCKAIGHPIIGDPVYFNKGDKKQLAVSNKKVWKTVMNINRQMLHARRISFDHPATQKRVSFTAEIPGDMGSLIAAFRESG